MKRISALQEYHHGNAVYSDKGGSQSWVAWSKSISLVQYLCKHIKPLRQVVFAEITIDGADDVVVVLICLACVDKR